MIVQCDRGKEGEVVFSFITTCHVSNGGSLRPSATPLVLYLPRLHNTTKKKETKFLESEHVLNLESVTHRLTTCYQVYNKHNLRIKANEMPLIILLYFL